MKFGLSATIINNICNILKNYQKIEKACIFGSRAKGNFKSTSDIDIVLFGDNLNLTIKYKIENDLDDLLLPYKIDIVLYNKIKDDKFKTEINRYQKIIFVRDK